MTAPSKKQAPQKSKPTSGSGHGVVKIACLIILTCVFLIGGIAVETQRVYEAAQQDYRQQAHNKALLVEDRIETIFQDMYQNIRSISKLPVVRNIAPRAGSLSPLDTITLQEMFNNLENQVAISKLYILPKDFNPEAGASREPIVTFDQIIIGRTVEDYQNLAKNQKGGADAYMYEYSLMSQHISWFTKRYPTLDKISGLSVPAVSGQEAVTSDTDTPVSKNAAEIDHSGIVYSMPFYDMTGQLKGTISAILLARVLSHALPEGHYAMFSSANHRNIIYNKPSDYLKASKSLIESGNPDTDVIYSETLPLSVQDIAGEWKLWVGFPDSAFMEFKGNEILTDGYIAGGAVIAIGISALLTLILFSRKYRVEKYALTAAREKAESANREKSAFVSNMIQNAVDGMITISDKGIMQTFNPAAEQIFGYTAKEAIGQNVSILMPEPQQSAHDSYIQAYNDTGNAKIIGIGREVKGKRKDGSLFTMDLAVCEVKVDGKRSFCGTVRDVSQRRKIQMQIIEATQKLQLIFDHIGEGIYGVNLEGRTIFGNKAAEEMLGYKLEEMFHKTQHELIHHSHADGTPYPKEECNIYQALQDGKIHKENKEVFWRKDGTSFPVEYTSAPMRDARGTITGAVVIFRSIAEGK